MNLVLGFALLFAGTGITSTGGAALAKRLRVKDAILEARSSARTRPSAGHQGNRGEFPDLFCEQEAD
jgi:hypothetical protein